MDIRLATSLRNEMKPLAVQGVYAADCHAQLRALLARHASFLDGKGMPDVAQLLAEPVYDEASGTIDWYAEGTGAAVCLASFPKAEQDAVLQRMATYAAAVEALAERERTDPRSSGMGAGLLKAALAHPSGAADVFLVDGHLVLVNWGFVLGAQETGPESIMRLGGATPQPKAPQKASAQDRGISAGQPSPAQGAQPPSQQTSLQPPQPPQQPQQPLPPASLPAGSGQPALPQPLVVCRERTKPLAWLAPLGLGSLALWLVLAGLGLAPSPLPDAFLRQESPQGRLERIKTAQLDDEEARLLASLQAHSAQCRPERQEPMESPLERKAVIPDLSAPEPEPRQPDVQARPDEPKAEEPKPEEPQEETKDEPKEEPKEAPRGDPRPLPSQEFKPDFKAEAPLPDVREQPRQEPTEEPKDEPKDEKKDEPLASPPEQTPFFGEAPLVPEEPEEKEAKEKPRTRPVVREKPAVVREKPAAAKEKPVQAKPAQPKEKPVPAREEPQPAPKPQPKPEAKAEAKPQPAPRRGEDLKIPEDAARRNDLSFLKGCWVSDTGLHNNHGVPIVGEYCFNGRGGGTRFVREPNGQRCSGRVQARFTGGGLHIDSQEAPCSNGTKYVPQRVECQGTGSSTHCRGYEIYRGGNRWNHRFRRK